MIRDQIKYLERWALLRTLMVATTAWSLTTWVVLGLDVEATRAVIRLTARISLTLFLAAFVAAALHRLAPSSFTAWLRRNRRQVGLGFAYSHLIHATAIFVYWRLDPDTFLAGRTPGSFIPGSVGYVFIIVMAVTSFDTTAKMIGPKAWRVVHTAGVWCLFILFATSFAKRVEAMPAYGGFLVILVVAVGVRAAGWVAARRMQSA